MTSGKEYSSAGGEPDISGTRKTVVCSPSQPAVILDGNKIVLIAYVINGSNYIKLRDIAAAIDFEVTWDPGAGSIRIDTGKGYEQP